MKYLQEFNEKQRKERATRAHDKQNRIKQRVQAANEMELRRKITMIRQWRANEKKRLNRLRQDRESKIRRLENEVISLRLILNKLFSAFFSINLLDLASQFLAKIKIYFEKKIYIICFEKNWQ